MRPRRAKLGFMKSGPFVSRALFLGGFVLAAIAVGCSVKSQRICTVPPTLEKTLENIMAEASRTPPDYGAQIVASRMAEEACVHRWAYRLAGSGDPAPVVAKAAFAGCDTAPAYGTGSRVDLYSRAGQPVSANQYHDGQAQELIDLALFHVVQARAGSCPVPD